MFRKFIHIFFIALIAAHFGASSVYAYSSTSNHASSKEWESAVVLKSLSFTETDEIIDDLCPAFICSSAGCSTIIFHQQQLTGSLRLITNKVYHPSMPVYLEIRTLLI